VTAVIVALHNSVEIHNQRWL